MPPVVSMRLALILSFFLLAGPGILLFSPMKNVGFGTGFVAAAVISLLYRIMQLRRFEHEVHLKGAPYMTAAGRAAYSTLSLCAMLACATVFGAAIFQSTFEIDAFRFLGALTSIVFLVFLWLFWFYQNQIDV